jgi:hypothetical protein
MGKVAILLPLPGRLWDPPNPKLTDPNQDFHYPKFYEQEAKALHYALMHAGYTVDFVDDTDLVKDALASRNYTTLYVTSPNVSGAAQGKVSEWVQKGGGTLVATLGAAVADEYNDPGTNLDAVLGVQARQATRDQWTAAGRAVTYKLFDPMFGAGEMELLGPVVPLVPLKSQGATAVAQLTAKGQAAGAGITVHQFERGRAVAYGFFPGVQYGYTPDQTDPERLPLRWGKSQRDLAVAPVRQANTPQPVRLSQEVVEACRLQSDKGIAVVLLNWTDEPIEHLEVTVPDVGCFHNVSSAMGVPLASTPSAQSIQVRMPLKDVDVLLIE